MIQEQNKDYHIIHSYEDACSILGVEPWRCDDNIPPAILAFHKLGVISEAIRGKNNAPTCVDTEKYYYVPYIILYSQKEKDEMWEKDYMDDFVPLKPIVGSVNNEMVYACPEFRRTRVYECQFVQFCQETIEQARFLFFEFNGLWADFLLDSAF